MQAEGIVGGITLLKQREKIAVFAMYATIGIFALTLFGELLELGGVIDLIGSPDEPLALAYTAILLGNFAVYIASVIVVAMWIHRGHANLHEAGITGLQFTPGWAVGWYFIPIANLFKPFQAMQELWNESHRVSGGFSAGAPGHLNGWWGCWIVGNILGNVSTRMSLMGDGGNVQVSLVLALGSSILTIGAAVLLIRIMREITTAQVDGIAVSQIFE
jgi:Domain of unknown function (DUF4328)